MSLLRFLKDNVIRLAVIITAIEVYVLTRWLGLTVTASAITAATFLFVGIYIEEVVRFRGIKGRLPNWRELILIVIGVAVETVAWILPVAFKTNAVETFAILFVGLELEHAIIAYATNGRFDLRGVLDFSAVEAFGGALWLYDPSLVTVIVLTGTSLVEHVQGIRQGLGLRS